MSGAQLCVLYDIRSARSLHCATFGFMRPARLGHTNFYSKMLNKTQSDDKQRPGGELRAFVAARIGGYSWVVDLVPNYELSIGSAPSADVRIELPDVAPKHAILSWNGARVTLKDAGSSGGIFVNGERAALEQSVDPGDEIRVGPAVLVVNITLAPSAHGRRSLTHKEFSERVADELSRSARTGRNTCLLMLKSKSGDGAAVANAALSSFRGGDVVGTYAHDEIEFLLPDTPASIARAVVERLLETAHSVGAAVGLAIAPDDGDNAERIMRAARDALARSIQTGEAFVRAGRSESEAVAPNVHSEATRSVVDEITRAAENVDAILLMGEPSSGKRFYARLFHERGPHRAGPFVSIQCPALVDPDALARAFGSEEAGVDDCEAERARGGTLVLDEIGDLPLQGQRRLLKLFEEGSEDYTIVSTTHRDLQALSQVGAFLPALYDKIAVRRIGVPALRMRAESIVPLAQNFAEQFKSDKPVKLSAGAIDKMRSYAWPGNVLELRNAMERAVRLADGGEILAEHLPGDVTDTGEGRLREHVGSVERDAIIKALADNNYNQTHAAKLLGISRRALIYKMEKYGLKQPPAGSRRDED
jgi:hypothetical protein